MGYRAEIDKDTKRPAIHEDPKGVTFEEAREQALLYGLDQLDKLRQQLEAIANSKTFEQYEGWGA